ncbi:MAG: hypothetical protein OEX02_20080 [Cyclobacteriaceae bacterium]|nr:hypothetical protein [Cyclobacteriaceae bacterium]
MIEKYKQLLQKQIEKLDKPDFDFEAWKGATLVILERIFGKNDLKLKQLEGLRVEYGNSWSMRAVTGSFDPLSSAKKQGMAIVEVAIDELEIFGMSAMSSCKSIFYTVLEEYLKVKEYNEMSHVVDGEQEPGEKAKHLTKLLRGLKEEECREILAKTLSQL